MNIDLFRATHVLYKGSLFVLSRGIFIVIVTLFSIFCFVGTTHSSSHEPPLVSEKTAVVASDIGIYI